MYMKTALQIAKQRDPEDRKAKWEIPKKLRKMIP